MTEPAAYLTAPGVSALIAALRARAAESGDGDAVVEAEVLAALLAAWGGAYAEALSTDLLDGDGDLTEDDVREIVARLSLLFGTGVLVRAAGRLFETLARGYTHARARALRAALPGLPPLPSGDGQAGGPPVAPPTPRSASSSGLPVRYTLGGPDARALAWLQEDTAWYVRTYADRVTMEAVREAGREALTAGLSRRDAGLLFGERLGAAYGQGQRYWTLLAANVTTRSREYGRLSGYEAAGLDTVYLSAVRDRRTSEVCRFLDGRAVKVADLVAARDAVLAITEPTQIRTVAPWRDVDTVRRLVTANGGVVPASIGLPPYHGHCRMRTVVKAPRREATP